jgi:hypothetical protein
VRGLKKRGVFFFFVLQFSFFFYNF